MNQIARDILAEECDKQGFRYAAELLRRPPEDSQWTSVAIAAMERYAAVVKETTRLDQ